MYNKQLNNLREKLNRRILRPLNKQQKFNFHVNLVHESLKKLPQITLNIALIVFKNSLNFRHLNFNWLNIGKKM